MTFAASALIASSTGYSGCLLGTHIVEDDADLRPLTPVSFADSRPALPGSVITLDVGVTSQTFDVTVFSESRQELQVHWYVDRWRPTCQPAANNCGTLIQDFIAAETVPQAAGSQRVVPARTFTFTPDNHCFTVDLYISSQFKTRTTEETHLPVRDGDVAFARWYVVRPDALGVIPSIQTCQREGR